MENQDYTPYGEEWKKEMAKLPKAFLINMAAKLGQEKEAIKDVMKEQLRYKIERLENPTSDSGFVCVPYYQAMDIIDNL